VFGMSKRMLIVIGLVLVVVALVVVQNKKKSPATQTGPVTSSGSCQVQVTADVLNIRSGPDGTATVVGKLSTGAVTAAQTTIQNGYRELATNRWASSQFLKPVSGSC
jgi:predicted permease